jgi:outer membrane protein
MKLQIRLICAILIAPFATLSHAVDLITLYHKAAQYDSGIAAAAAAYQAQKAGEKQAMAGLLPSLSATASTGHINSKSTSSDFSYNQTTYGLTLTQPLFRAGNWYALTAAEQNSKKAEADYLAAQQQLMLETATAYFNVLRADEDLATARATESAFEKQWEQAKERFDVGLIAITGVYEAKARYDATKTRHIQAQGQLTVATENLARLTGSQFTHLDVLKPNFPIAVDSAYSASAWVDSANNNNLSIKAAEFALKSLQAKLKQDKSGYYPTLDLNANYSKSNYRNFSGPFNNPESNSVTLALNLPLYSGGLTQATTRKTSYLVDQANRNLESIRRQVALQARTLYIKLQTDIDTVASNQQSIISSKSALEATKEGYKVGTRNIVEVLNAETNYFTAKGNYANSRFDFVVNSLAIKQAAGTLSVKDLQQVNQWLAPKTTP